MTNELSGQIIEHDGKFYREVERRAEVGELIRITGRDLGDGDRLDAYVRSLAGNIYEVIDVEGDLITTTGKWSDGTMLNLADDEYVVLKPIEPETGPQTQHEAIANLALKVAKLIEKVDAQEAAIDEILSRLGHVEADLDEPSAPMAELQLAILRADLPLDLRLDLLRESERLRNERLTKIAQMRAMDE